MVHDDLYHSGRSDFYGNLEYFFFFYNRREARKMNERLEGTEQGGTGKQNEIQAGKMCVIPRL